MLHTLSTPDYRPALSLMSVTADFSERLSTFSYSYEESCSLYPRCTPYFSVEHTVSPQSAVSNSSSGCSMEYTIGNLMRCVSYQSTAIALLGSQRGNPIVVGNTVMLSEWLQLIYSSLQWGASRLDCMMPGHVSHLRCTYPQHWMSNGSSEGVIIASSVSQCLGRLVPFAVYSHPLSQVLVDSSSPVSLSEQVVTLSMSHL